MSERKFGNSNILLILVFFFSLFYFQNCAKEKQKNILAKVGNEVITSDDFIFRYGLQPKPGARPRTYEDKKRFLDRMVENKLLALYGINHGYTTDPRILPQLKAITKDILIKELYQKHVSDQVKISDQELRDGFVKSKIKIRARHLFVKTKEKADSLLKMLNQGYTFHQLSRNLFRDTTLANNGGDVGYFTFGDMDEDFERAVYQLKPGEISGPVKTHWGYHIIKVEDRVENPMITESEFQTKKHRIKRVIRQRKEAQLANEYVRNFMKDKHVVVKAKAVNFLVAAARKIKKRADSLLPEDLPLLIDEEIAQIRKEIEVHQKDVIVEFAGGSWDIETFFRKIAETLPADRPDLTSHLSIAKKLAIMVRNEFLYEEALRNSLDRTDFARQRLNEETSRLVANLVREDVVNSIKIADEECRNYYQDHLQKYSSPPKFKLREIVLADFSQADRIYKQLHSNEDFAELARRYSIRKETARNGGAMGYISAADHLQIAKMIVNLKVGEISEPIFINGQYRIFQLLDKIEAKEISFQEVADLVKRDLQNERIRQKIDKIVAPLRDKYKVWVNYQLLKSLESEQSEKSVELIVQP